MSFIINEVSSYLKSHQIQRGDLIYIAIGNVFHFGIYDSCKSKGKIYYYHLGGPWANHENAYCFKHVDGNPSWLYQKINNPGIGSVDFTNTHADKRIFPIPKEMCTKLLLEIQHDFKKARNLL
jgi:hypothetical protein